MERQGTPTPPSVSKNASVVPSGLLSWRQGLAPGIKRMPSRLRFTGVGLIVATTVLVVLNIETGGGDDMKSRVASAVISGMNFRGSPQETEFCTSTQSGIPLIGGFLSGSPINGGACYRDAYSRDWAVCLELNMPA